MSDTTKSQYQDIQLDDLAKIIRENPQTFLTGQAGTGKSYTVNRLKQIFPFATVLSTTNVSAQIIGADTVHSVFKLGVCNTTDELEAYDNDYVQWFINNVNNDAELAKRTRLKDISTIINSSDLIIIDEVSMMSAEVLDLVFHRIKMVTDKDPEIKVPPILFTGDLFQLPPVAKDRQARMVFHSKNFNPKIIELKTIHRTENPTFQKALSYIRAGKYTETVHNQIAEIQSNPLNPNAITLCPTNRQCDEINSRELDKIDASERTYLATIETTINNKREVATIINSFTTDKEITLKVGCRVIFTAQEYDSTYYNGLQGTVTELAKNIIVTDDVGNQHKVVPHTFTKNKVVAKGTTKTLVPVLKMRQIPLRVAYAITYHKSQGMSILDLNIDCKNIFEKSMFYVAISRGIDPKHIHISNFDRRFVKLINEESFDYMVKNADNVKRVGSVIDVIDVSWVVDL